MYVIAPKSTAPSDMAVYSSALGVIGKGRLWALEYRPESKVVAQFPESVKDLMAAESAQAAAKWADWLAEANR